MKYNSLIFDLDGTLLNTIPDIVTVVNSVIGRFGINQKNQEQVKAGVGFGVEHLLRTLGVPEHKNSDATLEMEKGFSAVNCSEAFVYPGVVEMIQQISDSGIRIFLLSNKLQSGVDKSVSDHLGFVNFLSTRGSLPGKPAKPTAEVLLEMMKEFHISPESVLFVGDGEPDVMVSKAAGIDCLSVLWGFRSKDELVTAGAKLFAETPADVVDFIFQVGL